MKVFALHLTAYFYNNVNNFDTLLNTQGILKKL